MTMYYLFMTKKSDLDLYKKELDRVCEAIEQGKTPVFNEMRNAKTNLVEAFPFNCIQGFFIILGAILISKIGINETIKIAVVLVINGFCGASANYIFTYIKHFLRIRLCKKLGIEATEKNIALMESLEYQSV